MFLLKSLCYFILFFRLFKDIGFSLEIESNLKEADFLDVSLNLRNWTYRPYEKSNEKLLYIHSLSNQPANVLKQISNSIQERHTSIAKREYEMLWRKMSSNLILNTPKINDKNQKIELEILLGLTYHLAKPYLQMLQKLISD